MATEYSVSEAKAKLSEILRLVKAHREVTITEHGRKVARVCPALEVKQNLAGRVSALSEQGLIRPARRSPSQALAAHKPKKRIGALGRFLRNRD